MCIKCVTWRICYFNTKRAILLSLGIIISFFLFNIHLVFNFKSKNLKNKNFIEACVNSKTMISWLYVIIIDFIDFLQ